MQFPTYSALSSFGSCGNKSLFSYPFVALYFPKSVAHLHYLWSNTHWQSFVSYQSFMLASMPYTYSISKKHSSKHGTDLDWEVSKNLWTSFLLVSFSWYLHSPLFHLPQALWGPCCSCSLTWIKKMPVHAISSELAFHNWESKADEEVFHLTISRCPFRTFIFWLQASRICFDFNEHQIEENAKATDSSHMKYIGLPRMMVSELLDVDCIQDALMI